MTSRGGHRPGAGRRTGSGPHGEKTVTMRVPESLKPSIVSLLDARQARRLAEAGAPLPFPSLGGTVVLAYPMHPRSPELVLRKSGIRAQAGQAMALDDFAEDGVDLNQLLVDAPEWTYLMEVTGTSMDQAGLAPGSLMVVNRRREPRHGNIVVAVILGEAVTVKRLEKSDTEIALVPESSDPSHQRRVLTEFDEWVVWGVVTDVIRRLC